MTPDKDRCEACGQLRPGQTQTFVSYVRFADGAVLQVVAATKAAGPRGGKYIHTVRLLKEDG